MVGRGPIVATQQADAEVKYRKVEERHVHRIVENSTRDADLLGRGVSKQTLCHLWVLGVDAGASTSNVKPRKSGEGKRAAKIDVSCRLHVLLKLLAHYISSPADLGLGLKLGFGFGLGLGIGFGFGFG